MWACTRSAGSKASPRWRWASTPSSPRSPTPASNGRTSSSPPEAAGRWPTPTRSSAWWGCRASRSPTCSTPAPPRPAPTKACADGIRLGDYDIGIAVGLDKHPRGAFTEDPALVGMPSWYAENGQYLTTQFFGMKANRYLHDHGISQADAGQGRRQELPQRCAEPECVPAQADPRGPDPQLDDAELSPDPVHVLRARRGSRRGRHVPRRHRTPLHVEAGVPARRRGPHPHATVPTR